MQTTMENYMAKQKLNKEIFYGRTAVALLLSIVVVIGVFWWLKLVGITMAGEAFCGIQEHQHGETCYESVEVCTFEEHIHTSDCYSDSAADVETQTMWEETLANIEETWCYADRITAIAKSQVGYCESVRNFQVDAEGVRRGYTRYGEWYGHSHGDWSAMFVGFCMHYSGATNDYISYASGVEALRTQWEGTQLYQSKELYTPEKGDVLFLDNDADGKTDIAGIITLSEGDMYNLVAGDWEHTVAEVQLSKDDARIMGASVQSQILSAMIDEETEATIAYLNEQMELLPTYEEAMVTLAAYEAAGDEEGYANYFTQLATDSETAYTVYKDVGIFGPLVHQTDKFEFYSSLWVQTMALVEEVSIPYVNYHTYQLTSGNILIYDGTVDDHTLGMSYMYYNAYVVERDTTGYYVDQKYIGSALSDKRPLKASADGFVLLLTSGIELDVEVGDRVAVDFNYKGISGHNANGYGKVSVVKHNGLVPITSADTSELIEVNLFNYGNNINEKFVSNSNYPGFQQEYGTRSLGTSLASGSFNYGNNITVDIKAGINGVTTTAGRGEINKTTGGSIVSNGVTVGAANAPLSKVMNYNLVNGYPALGYTAANFDSSLSYLFKNNIYATQLNLDSNGESQNINGLFLRDETTGNYYFDSRLHHAQYNAEKNVFELYEERLTPNYMMYPFGNFLPFNNINEQATNVRNDIDRSYFSNIAKKAQTKYNNGYGGYTVGTTTRNEYQELANALTSFVSLMDKKHGTSWSWKAGISDYFALTAPPDMTNSTTEPDREATLENQMTDMYNLDYDEPTDFYFGMSMHMNFIMPKDGLTGPNGDQPMRFDFNGDDDVWVYVDGKLVLDLSGIHRHVGGRIDFQNGRVSFYGLNVATGEADLSIPVVDENGNYPKYIHPVTGEDVYYVPLSRFLGTEMSKELNEKGTFKDYTQHTIDFYYMERGSGSSVCNMEFNFPLLQKNSISVTKDISSTGDISVIGNPDFNFQILKPDGATPFIGEGVEYTIMNASNQMEIGKGVTGVNGVFSLKAGQTAVFPNISEDAGQYFVRELLDPTVFAQYGTVTVDGQSITSDHYKTDVVVGADSFVGVDSAIKDISDGNTAFTFTNNIDIYKFGALGIYKQFHDYQSGLAPREVTFELQIDDKPVAINTPYQVNLADGTTEERMVTTEGQITFRSDEHVLFPRIIAGTKVRLREMTASSSGYDVSYTGSEGFKMETIVDGEGPYMQGLIPAGSQATIHVDNHRIGTKLSIPVHKTLLYGDGLTHTYHFVLQQINGLNDLTANGIYIKKPVTLATGTVPVEFMLNYVPGTADGKYYYLLSEEGASNTNGVDMTRYVIEVTVTTVGGTTTAAVTGRYLEDGTPVAGVEPLSFTNHIVRSLTVKKTVQNIQSDTWFEFHIYAQTDEGPLTGTYYCDGSEEGAEVVFVNGEATIRLKHEQAITVHNLPYGTTWTVTETGTDGYIVKSSVNGEKMKTGPEVSGTLSVATTVEVFNIGGYELPSTGSAAHLWYTHIGIGLMLSSLVTGYILRRRYERRINESL